MKLIDDAGKVWHRFWSVRLSAVSVLLGGRRGLAGARHRAAAHPRAGDRWNLGMRRLLAPGGAAEAPGAADG
jgi:hypothetical protein